MNSLCTTTDCIWIPFTANDNEKWLIKYDITSVHYEIAISNMAVVYKEKLESNNIEKRCLLLNPRLDAPVSAILNYIKVSIADQQKLSTIFSIRLQGDKTLQLCFSNKFCNKFPFSWDFEFVFL